MDPITEKELNSYLFLEPFFAFSDKDSEAVRQEFLNVFVSLPLSIKNIIAGTTTLQFILGLAEELQIPTQKLEGLSRIIRDVLIAKIHIGSMQNLIQEYLWTDQSQTRTIASKIVSELFAPAIEDVKALQRASFNDAQRQPTNPSAVDARTQPNTKSVQINQNNIIDLRDKKE